MRVCCALALGVILALAFPQMPATGAEPAPGDWPRFTRDLGGTRYSPLKTASMRRAFIDRLRRLNWTDACISWVFSPIPDPILGWRMWSFTLLFFPSRLVE